MKEKILNEIRYGNAPLHLLSIKKNENRKVIFHSRTSKLLKTNSMITYNLYKSAL